MIERITKKKHLRNVIEFFTSFFDYDFYITENNARIYISDYSSIYKLYKQSSLLYTAREKGHCLGVLSVWKSLGGEVARYYIKLGAVNEKIAEQLLTILLWNFSKDLYVKIRKDNKFISLLKKKGFRFQGGRGSQVLLYRKFIPTRPLNERNPHNYRDNDPLSSKRNE